MKERIVFQANVPVTAAMVRLVAGSVASRRERRCGRLQGGIVRDGEPPVGR